MDEIERRAVAEGLQVGDRRRWRGNAQRRETLEAEDGVVKIALTGPVLKSTIGVHAALEKCTDEIARITQQRRREPRDLQHFAPQTHCTIP
jgi:hypothetical protein